MNAFAWEPQTFSVLRRFAASDASYIDIGAWIGPTALFAASLAKRVYAIEPDPVAHAELVSNVQLNPELAPRLVCSEVCITASNGFTPLYTGGMYYGPANELGDSMSSIAGTGSVQPSTMVEGLTLGNFMAAHQIDDCNFIKMDVEGGEYELIPNHWREAFARGQPTLFASFHAPAPDRRQRLIGDCVEELLLCYPRLYSAYGVQLEGLPEQLDAVQDWRDEASGSPWSTLDRLLGAGGSAIVDRQSSIVAVYRVAARGQ